MKLAAPGLSGEVEGVGVATGVVGVAGITGVGEGLGLGVLELAGALAEAHPLKRMKSKTIQNIFFIITNSHTKATPASL